MFSLETSQLASDCSRVAGRGLKLVVSWDGVGLNQLTHNLPRRLTYVGPDAAVGSARVDLVADVALHLTRS